MSSFIAGPYTATYDSVSIGLTTQGFTLSHEFFKRLITADQFGDGPVNAIYRGRAQFIEFESLEAGNAAIHNLMDPYASVVGGIATPLTMGAIGQFDVDVSFPDASVCSGAAKSLVLTKIAGSCATPATVTLPLSIIAEGYPIRQLYAQELRTIPLRMRVYPSAAGFFGATT